MNRLYLYMGWVADTACWIGLAALMYLNRSHEWVVQYQQIWDGITLLITGYAVVHILNSVTLMYKITSMWNHHDDEDDRRDDDYD